MAISNRPDEHDSRDDRPSTTDRGAPIDPGTSVDSDTPTRVERTSSGATPMATAGTAVPPAPTTSADETEATRPIFPPTSTRGKNEQHTPVQADGVELHRKLTEQLGIARTRNRGSTDIGLLILRVMNVVMFLHGLAKATGYSAFRDTVAANSLGALAPDLFAVLVLVGQLALPVALAFGLLTRLAGLLQAVMMAVIWVLFPLSGGPLADTGGIVGEGAYLFVAIGLALTFTGPGRISIDHVLFATGFERRKIKQVEKKLS